MATLVARIMPTDKRRRQKQERAQRRAAQRKAAARREMLRRVGIAVGLGAVVAAVLLLASALSSGDEDALPPAYQAYREQPTACDAEAPPPAEQMRFDAPGDPELPEGEPVRAVVSTSCGDFTIDLASEDYPQTVESFVFLARQGFYDGTVFHRIREDFVIQGGDPTASGREGPGYRIPDELPPPDFTYEEGVVAMANSGEGTTGSQFFVVVGPQAAALTADFNVLGRVVAGQDILDRIAEVPTIAQQGSVERSRPTRTVYVESVEIVSGDGQESS